MPGMKSCQQSRNNPGSRSRQRKTVPLLHPSAGLAAGNAGCHWKNTAFLQVPRIEDRKPVFVSCEVRDRLDEYVRKLGSRRMSVSGLLENIARQHLEIYSEDFERWRKL